MADFNLDLEIFQDENYSIKAPKGYKSVAWQSKSGRPGRVIFDKYSPDYDASDCYITVSTIAVDPITDEIRRRVSLGFGKEGYDFSFETIKDRHFVFYQDETEVDYRHYHAIIVLNELKAILMDVVFNVNFDNSKEVAYSIMSSIYPNFKVEVSDEELAADKARLAAEADADAAKEAARQAQIKAANGEDVAETPAGPTPEEIARQNALDALDAAEKAVEGAEATQFVTDGAEALDASLVEELPVEEAEVVEEVAEVATEEVADVAETTVPGKPDFTDDADGKEKQLIYNVADSKPKFTMNDLATIPELNEVGRMGINKIINSMIRDGILTRIEDADNIYFAIPGKADATPEVEEAPADSALDPMEQYRIDMERYKEELAEWKKSRSFITGKSDKPKPVEPKKPKKSK